jgi:DNA (cytosine-5)-methyltransferase 1
MCGHPAPSREQGERPANTLAARTGGSGWPDGGDGRHDQLIASVLAFGGNNTAGPVDVATACRAKGGTGHGDFETETFVIVPFDETQITSKENRSHPRLGDPSPTLAKGARPPSVAFNVFPVSGQAVDLRAEPTDVAGAITASQLDKQNNRGTRIVDPAWSVRRLTPEECEVLQGFPIGYTRIVVRGKPAADGPRYRAIGNSFATYVVRYIGERIKAVMDQIACASTNERKAG